MPRMPQLRARAVQSIQQSVATPKELKDAIYARYAIDHDPCPLDGHKTGPDGLDRRNAWGKRNYVNPPYVKNGIQKFVDRAIEEMNNGNSSYFLMPFRAGLQYYHRAMAHCTGVLFFGKHLKFEGYTGVLPQQLVLMEFEANKPAHFTADALGEVLCWR